MPSEYHRERSQLRQTIAYGYAAVLPILSSVITVRTPALHEIPFALSFTTICALGALAGFGPALLSIAVSIISFNLPYSAPLHTAGTLTFGRIERSLVLVSAAFFITLLSWKQRSTQRMLRSTLSSLRERTEALSQAQQASELATWVFNADTMETFWDEGSTEIFGRPFAELHRKALPLEFVHPDDRNHLSDALRAAVETGHPLRLEFRALWPDDEVRWLEVRGSRISSSSNLWRGSTFDITRRKRVESALLRSEKLAAMGRLASTIAHEVNNPLESVTNLLYLMRQDNSLAEPTRSYLTLAEQELARLSHITRLTLSFARSPSVSVVDLAEVCDSVLSIYRHRCDSLNISVQRNLTPGAEIEIPPHELRQILVNLIANAIDAVQGDSRIIRLQGSMQEDHAILLVEDNGAGIDTAHQAHVFDAFFTTKADMGTGIGLWVTRELVEKNNGTIFVESGDLGEGMRTRFRLQFPLATPKPAEVVAEPPAELIP